MTPAEWGIAFTVIAVGALVQGTAGFGSAVVAAPVLAMLDPVFVPGPMLCCAVVLAVAMTVRERSALNLRGLGWSLIGRLPGTAAGAAVVVVSSKRSISIGLAAVVLLAVGLSIWAPRVAPTPRTLFAAGLVGGFMGTASSIGGPPMALVYQDARGPELRVMLSSYFAIGAFVSLVSLAVVGHFGAKELRYAGALMLPMLAGLAASGPAARVLDRGRTREAVLVISAVAAVVLLTQTLA